MLSGGYELNSGELLMRPPPAWAGAGRLLVSQSPVYAEHKGGAEDLLVDDRPGADGRGAEDLFLEAGRGTKGPGGVTLPSGRPRAHGRHRGGGAHEARRRLNLVSDCGRRAGEVGARGSRSAPHFLGAAHCKTRWILRRSRTAN
jgi:hypothetical protein